MLRSQSAVTSKAPIALAMGRLDAIGAHSAETRRRVNECLELALAGLPQMYLGDARFVQTMRGSSGLGPRTLRPEGDNLRYAAIVALGLAQVGETEQCLVLRGDTAADLALAAMRRAGSSSDTGALALAAWAAAEVAGVYATELFARLDATLASDSPIDTVDCGWTLSAAIAARWLGDTKALCHLAAKRLLAAQGSTGLFPHKLPARAIGILRAHVGCFADQVYSIQSLARYATAFGNDIALAAADRCAARICELQGTSGQYWWHYDVRNGGVVEGYPVYSVHQHAMAPMALFDLLEAGGTDHWRATVAGMSWLDRHPELTGDLVCSELGVIWRKIGRHEPRKAVRSIATLTTALRPGLRLPGLDAAFPHNRIDYECRPYELGWMLYAWLSSSANRD